MTTTEERLKRIEGKYDRHGFASDEDARWLVARIRKLEALRVYARHSSGCEKYDDEVCFCGYTKAWAALKEQP